MSSETNVTKPVIIQDGFSANLDSMLDLEYRILIVIASLLVMVMNGLSFISLNRTRHTPRTARFLSSSLLVFDFVATLIYTVRKTIDDPRFNLLFQLLGMGCTFLGYLDITIMSIERLIVFHWPNFYLRRISFKVFKTGCIITWSMYLSEWLLELLMCLVFLDMTDLYSRFCFRRVIERHLMGVYAACTLISCCCLIKISVIIAGQSNKVIGKKGAWKNNKATVVVLICIINYLLTTVCAVAMTYLIHEAYKRRLFVDILMITNGFLDTCIYVLWFKECRLELLKLFGSMFPSFMKKADKMRIEIFNINTYSKSQNTTSKSPIPSFN